jgi:hypothetical protein
MPCRIATSSASGWDGYVHLDCRAAKPILDAPFAEAVVALRESRWDRAAESLQGLPEETERHPLARLLRAWCIEHDGRLGSRSLFATLLRAAVQADAPEVLRFIAQGNLRSLSDAARYSLMARTKDAELVAELLVREAELTKDKKRAGDLAWQVHESGRLGDARTGPVRSGNGPGKRNA